MARNGSGTYNRAVSPYTAGTTITAATVNSEMDDVATALTGSMARDGQSPATANIPMGGFRLTGLGNAIANTDAAALGQVMPRNGSLAATADIPMGGFKITGLAAGTADTDAANFAQVIADGTAWVDLASAATTDLGAQTSNNLRITGTTTITGFGTAASGVRRELRFAGALTLTHNATSLILPGGANITTAAGDTATAVSLGSGNWVVANYQRAAVVPLAQTPPITPTSAAGPGNWLSIAPGSGLAAVLPAGGTWAYSIFRIDNSNGTFDGNFASSIAAGGTTIGAALAGRSWVGFAWRIA
jgi:hypothetical protein